MSQSVLRSEERRVVATLAGAYGLRMIGLYLVLPVLSLHAAELGSSTPILIGLAVGSYGFTQMLLQIPFGLLSDRHGRKPVIAAGLLIFSVGSVVAGLAVNAWVLILGRCIQGSGAIASAIIATLADRTRSEVRTQAMAVVGISIGLAFACGFIFGPPLAARFGVPFIFYLTAIAALVAIPLLVFGLPGPERAHDGPAVDISWKRLRTVLHNGDLLRINLGIFLLHFSLTGLLVILPFVLDQYVGQGRLWHIYAPILIGGLVLMVIVARSADSFHRSRAVAHIGAGAVILAFLVVSLLGENLSASIVSLALFVVGVAILEPLLPSLLSRHAPPHYRGTAAGAFSMWEFLGSFLGGLMGGLGLKTGHATFYGMVVGAFLIWTILIRSLPPAPTHNPAPDLPGSRAAG